MTKTSLPRLRIPRDERLPFVGRFGGDGQFLTSVVLAGQPGDRSWFAVLHTFDGDGHHRASHVFLAGEEDQPEVERRAHEQQQFWLRQLSTMLLGPIDVEPFVRESHGLRFGAVEVDGTFRLEPEGIPLSSAPRS